MAQHKGAKKATTAERRRKALDLRKTGATYEQIGEHLRISKQAAHKLVTKALEEIQTKTMEDAATVKTLEVERLDRLLLALWPDATRGKVTAIDRVLKLMERRARLLGLDGPEKVAPTDPTGEKPYELPVSVTDEERAARILELIERAREAGTG